MKLLCQIAFVLSVTSALVGLCAKPGSAQESAPADAPPLLESKALDDEQEDKVDDGASVKVTGGSEGATDQETQLDEFMRVEKDGKKPQALQTAVVTYRAPEGDDGEPVEVTLIGAVHIAESTYYSRLNQLFRNYDSLLFEMVMDPEMGIPEPEDRGVSPVSTIQVGMKDMLDLSFQLDEIDYSAKNFVHADMTPQEFFTTMKSRNEGVMQLLLRSMGASLAMQSSGKGSDLEVITALMSNDSKALRRAFAEQIEMADGQMAALTGKDGKSTLITERNAKAFEVLDSEIAAGKKKLGVFYGAGHLKDMDKRLREKYGMKIVENEWLDAWDLR